MNVLLPKMQLDVFSVRVRIDYSTPISRQISELRLVEKFDGGISSRTIEMPRGKATSVFHLVHLMKPRHPTLDVIQGWIEVTRMRCCNVCELLAVIRRSNRPKAEDPYMGAVGTVIPDSGGNPCLLTRVGHQLHIRSAGGQLDLPGGMPRMVFATR